MVKKKSVAVATEPAMPPALKDMAYPIDKLTLDPNNARMHGERNLTVIRDSLKQYGWRGLVVATRDGTVLVGNARVTVAREMGWQHAPVLFVDDEKAKAMAFAIADNRSAELAEWDLQELSRQLKQLDDADEGELLRSVGFSQGEIDNLLNAEWEPAQVEAGDDLTQHRRADGAPESKQEKATIVLSSEELEVVMQALDQHRRAAPKATIGQVIATACRSYITSACTSG